MRKDIDGILFDLGDTLLNFGKVDALGLFEAGARLGYDYLQSLDQDLPPFATYHRKQLRAIRWSYFKSHLTRREFNSLELMRKLCRKMGQDLSEEQLVELTWLWYQPLSEKADIEPGTREMLVELRDQGLRLGVVSNTFVPGEVLDRHLAQEGMLDLLPVRIYSCDVGFRKPHPKIFRKALDETGLEAGRTLFVGDSPRADVYGATRSGLISVLKVNEGSFIDRGTDPDHRITSILELRDVLRRYNPQG